MLYEILFEKGDNFIWCGFIIFSLISLFYIFFLNFLIFFLCWNNFIYFLIFQTISYMAERVVGHGSFGVVFQVTICNQPVDWMTNVTSVFST
jgi:hypothetical protein